MRLYDTPTGGRERSRGVLSRELLKAGDAMGSVSCAGAIRRVDGGARSWRWLDAVVREVGTAYETPSVCIPEAATRVACTDAAPACKWG